MSDVRLTGGCQCGAVRYVLTSQPERPCICYCRMCQKAMGNAFGMFAGVPVGDFALTRGEITWWTSSHTGRRGFCKECGTPVAWGSAVPGDDYVSVTIGSLDEPERVKPIIAYDAEAKVSWTDEAVHIQALKLGEGRTADWPFVKVRTTNRQHPDHDTDVWPPVPS